MFFAEQLAMATPYGDGQDEGAICSKQQLLKSDSVAQSQCSTYQSSDHGRIIPAWRFGDAKSHP